MQRERALIVHRDGQIAALGDEVDGGGALDREELRAGSVLHLGEEFLLLGGILPPYLQDRKSTRLNSSHVAISYAVFCLKKKKICILYNMTAMRDAVTQLFSWA